MEKSIRILLVDDHPLILMGLQSMLDSQAEIEVVGAVNNGSAALEMAEKLTPDVILLDVIMPGMDGVEVARRVKAQMPEIKLLMLSSDASPAVLESLMQIGIEGFVSKMASEESLLRAIRSVADGYEYYGTDIARLIDRIMYAKKASKSMFSPRELDIIRLGCEGLQYKEIAARLGISDLTVAKIKRNIFTKLEINNSVELVLYALRNHLISL